MGLRDRLRRLQRAADEELITFELQDGTEARFPQSALRDAYANHMARMGAGEDAPPEHPLLAAARNSSDPKWRESVYVEDPEAWVQPVEDLSEP